MDSSSIFVSGELWMRWSTAITPALVYEKELDLIRGVSPIDKISTDSVVLVLEEGTKGWGCTKGSMVKFVYGPGKIGWSSTWPNYYWTRIRL